MLGSRAKANQSSEQLDKRETQQMNTACEDPDFASNDSETLCTGCGICCKGYVFDHGPVEKEEVDTLKVTSVSVYRHCDKFYFSMPCPANYENRCTVYSSRPQTCVKFKCVLLDRLAAREIKLIDALKIVHDFKQIMEKLEDNEAYREISSDSVMVRKNLLRASGLFVNSNDNSLKKRYGETSLLLDVAARFVRDNFAHKINSLFGAPSSEETLASLRPRESKGPKQQGVRREREAIQEVVDIKFWQSFAPNFNICEPASFVDISSSDFSESELGEARTRLTIEGYVQEECKWMVDCNEMAKLVGRLSNTSLPNVFAFVYDEFWLPFFQLHPILSSLLGRDYFMLPHFWVWNIDPAKGEAGWKPHRDKGRKSLDNDGSPKSITVWIPLSEVTPLNGCMYLVPAYLDPTYNTGRENQEEFAYSSIRALPGRPGDFFVWNQAVFHWGGKSSPRASTPRVSMAVEFQRADVEAFDIPLISPLSPPPFEVRLKLIAKQVLQYRHMYQADKEIVEFAKKIYLN